MTDDVPPDDWGAWQRSGGGRERQPAAATLTTAQGRAIISLNTTAREHVGRHARLAYDADTRRIRLVGCDADHMNAFAVHRSIGAQSFAEHFGILDAFDGRTIPATLVKPGVLDIQL